MTFCVFLLISTGLWLVMSLNQDVQQDIRCRIEIVNQPDSVTMISYPPDHISVSVKSRGSQLVKYSFGSSPTITLDYNTLARNNRITLGVSDMRVLLRDIFGQNAQIISFNPDTLNLTFTSQPGVYRPVRIDTRITTRSDVALSAAPKCVPESVVVYSTEPLDPLMDYAKTQPIQYNNITESKTIRTRVIVPTGCRAVPDSVDIVLRVEPLVARTIQLPITAINVPDSVRLILLPTTVSLSYMVPASHFRDQVPPIKVYADYRSLDLTHPSRRIGINADNTNAPSLRNIRLNIDSVEYLIER